MRMRIHSTAITAAWTGGFEICPGDPEVVGTPEPSFFAAFVVAVYGAAARSSLSDTWQLVINTGTTIVTFLMVFLIRNTQNRDAHAVHLEARRANPRHKGARMRSLA